MDTISEVPEWTVDFDGTNFVVTNISSGVDIIITTPVKVDTGFKVDRFAAYEFMKRDLKESSIHPVHVMGGQGDDQPRVGMLIPVNALGSDDHDEANRKYFQCYSFVAINLALQALVAENPQILGNIAAEGRTIPFSELYDDNVCFFVISLDNAARIESFEVVGTLPSLVGYGYVPAGLCMPGELEWVGSPPRSKKIKVTLTSSSIGNSELIARLITLAVTSGRSLVTQFFYFYQVFEYLMESVMRHRLPLVLKDMVKSLDSGTASVRDQFDLLGDQIREKGRLKLLVSEYSDCSKSLSDFGLVASQFLSERGINSDPGIDAIYKVRNFLFHQARDLPSHDDPFLADVVSAFAEFLPVLLASYRIPEAPGVAA